VIPLYIKVLRKLNLSDYRFKKIKEAPSRLAAVNFISGLEGKRIEALLDSIKKISPIQS
jgi:hypothetical protein